jgi:SPP1 family predicted phage head-tail adaptor
MSLAAGRLRDRIQLRRRSSEPDGDGGTIDNWGDHGTPIAAEVVSQDGREAVIASALQGVSVSRITIRYRPDVVTTDQLRVLGDDRDWNIRSAEDPDRRRERLVILADTASPQR